MKLYLDINICRIRTLGCKLFRAVIVSSFSLEYECTGPSTVGPSPERVGIQGHTQRGTTLSTASGSYRNVNNNVDMDKKLCHGARKLSGPGLSVYYLRCVKYYM